jgi:hypothetical protein
MGLNQCGNEIDTPIAQPWYEWSAGYCGMAHDEEITPAVRHAWEVAAIGAAHSGFPWQYLSRVGEDQETEPRMPGQVRQFNDLLLTVNFLIKRKYSTPQAADAASKAKTPLDILLAKIKSFLPSQKMKVLQRVPASPGWYNVYLTDREPWFHLRTIAFWMLVRRPRLESAFGLPTVIGVDGGVNCPAVGGGQGFVEMIHKNQITAATTERWTSAAKKVIVPYPTGQEG